MINKKGPQGKKGQFYMVAILVIISIFIAFTVINNTAFTSHSNTAGDLITELKIEKQQVLDYITKNDLTSAQVKIIFTNFSNSYLEKIGQDKDSFFIFGDTNNVKIIGYKTSITNASYFNGTGYTEISSGAINIETPITNEEIIINLNDNSHLINLYEGQNLYYLINYNYNKEVYIIYG